MPFGSWWHARGRGHCRREKPGSALSGEYAPDSARAKDSLIVDAVLAGLGKDLSRFGSLLV